MCAFFLFIYSEVLDKVYKCIYVKNKGDMHSREIGRERESVCVCAQEGKKIEGGWNKILWREELERR